MPLLYTIYFCGFSLDHVKILVPSCLWLQLGKDTRNPAIRSLHDFFPRSLYLSHGLKTCSSLCLQILLFILFRWRFFYPSLPLFPSSSALSLSPFFFLHHFEGVEDPLKLVYSRYLARLSSHSPSSFSELYLRCLDKRFYLLVSRHS